MTDEEINEIEKRCNEATEGPYIHEDTNCFDTAEIKLGDGEHTYISLPYSKDKKNENLIKFLVGSRTDIPILIEAVKETNKKLAHYQLLSFNRLGDINKLIITVIGLEKELKDLKTQIKNLKWE